MQTKIIIANFHNKKRNHETNVNFRNQKYTFCFFKCNRSVYLFRVKYLPSLAFQSILLPLLSVMP